MKHFSCRLPEASFGSELFFREEGDPSFAGAAVALDSPLLLISDSCVLSLHAYAWQQEITHAAGRVELLSFPAGEQNKTREVKAQLEDQIFQLGWGQDLYLVALGGGVTMDLVGYLAATYGRGVPHVLVPTTLLGMVDACLGGKTGVNTPYGKNSVGVIYPARKIFVDPTLLKTLPEEEWKQGVAEMIKHALIEDVEAVEQLEHPLAEPSSKRRERVEKLIFSHCLIKKKYLERTLQGESLRPLLNFGHTIGHALELLSGYTLPHGEAVALGILGESYLSHRLLGLPPSSLERIERLLRGYGFLRRRLPKYSMEDFLAALQRDKKARGKIPHFVLLEEIGCPHLGGGKVCHPIAEPELVEVIAWIYDVLSID